MGSYRAMSTYGKEFQEIAHCGGQFTIDVSTGEGGRRMVQFGVQHSRPTPAAFFGVYALPQGIPVGTIRLGDMGSPWNPAPHPDSLPVFIASDSLGMFGHQCRRCKGYWRSKGAPSGWKMTCPYCGLRAEAHVFLTDGQTRYVAAWCELFRQAVSSDKDGQSIMDMDVVVDSASKDCEKPKFYYAEQSQQNKYECSACGESNDILGRYGYCSSCGTYNGLQELEGKIESVRERIETGGQREACVKDTVAAFDSFARQLAQQLAKRVPMKAARRSRWERALFHNLKPRAEELNTAFEIDIFEGLKPEEINFAVLMFHRRHVYEHNGGEVDEKYIRDSGDTTVRPKQVIRETPETASRITELVINMGRNLHKGFHEIFLVEETPIRWHRDTTRKPTDAVSI